MRPLNELINSGKTLTKQEREAVERNIWAKSKPISTKQFNYLCGQAAARGDFYTRYRKKPAKQA